MAVAWNACLITGRFRDGNRTPANRGLHRPVLLSHYSTATPQLGCSLESRTGALPGTWDWQLSAPEALHERAERTIRSSLVAQRLPMCQLRSDYAPLGSCAIRRQMDWKRPNLGCAWAETETSRGATDITKYRSRAPPGFERNSPSV